MLEIDGSQGEGGGQLLRTSLTLSMLTRQPFRMIRIRARRSRPGLQRQHLAAVEAARQVCGARVEGAERDSQCLAFVPGPARAGRYDLDIGTAGSCTLVLQTILLPLALADSPSVVRLRGGTHNLAAPPFDFLALAWLPLIARMGARISLELLRHGFYPRGGGEILARIEPGRLAPLELPTRGPLRAIRAGAVVADLPRHIAERELGMIAERFSLPQDRCSLRELPRGQGPGNVVTLVIESGQVTEVFTGFGERGVPAEAVAERACAAAERYLASTAAAGRFLADQLLLPFAAAGAGSFTATEITSHFRSNAAIISRFLAVRVATSQTGDAWKVAIEAS